MLRNYSLNIFNLSQNLRNIRQLRSKQLVKKRQMSTFSIKDLEQLTGVKAHTIRIWEQRYNLLSPKRTSTNIRFYDDEDLKLLLNVSLLNDNGFKISKIADMGEGEIQREVIQLTEASFKSSEQIHALTISMVDLDEDRFEKILSSLGVKLGFERTMIEVIYPFFTKIGILWQTGAINPAQEHFMSNLVRQKLIVAINDRYVPASSGSPAFLLYLPEGEMHELSLLFADYLLKSKGIRTIYLGQSLPFKDLVEVCKIHNPPYILSVITSTPGPSDIQKYVDKLGSSFPATTIILSGYQIVGQDLDLPENAMILNRIEDLVEFVKAHAETEA